jgi:RNA polymerase sigma-70 factor, ECF subfamily
METDEALMLEVQAGSRDALEALFVRYREPLYGFFRRRLNVGARAEDLTQETFLAVLRGRARYQPRAAVRTYLYGIAMNLLHAERRRSGKHVNLSHSYQEGSSKSASGDSRESAFWVQQGLGKLDGTEREIIMLREYEQLTYAEIAELLRLPINTVRSRLFRARTALKEILEPQETVSRKEA